MGKKISGDKGVNKSYTFWVLEPFEYLMRTTDSLSGKCTFTHGMHALLRCRLQNSL